MGWQVKVGDLTLAEDDLTVAEACDISRLAGGGWETLNPLHSPQACASIVTLLLVKGGAKERDAQLAVMEMKADDLLAAVIVGQ